MGLLQDIIEDARRSSLSTTELLRSVRVLAARGRADDLGEWVKRELTGYAEDLPLPPYRGPYPAQVIGHFVGPFGSEQRRPMPTFGYPAEFDSLFRLELRGPLAELEAMLERGDEPALVWSANVVARANKLMDDGKVTHIEFHELAGVTVPVPQNVLVAAVNGVRDRILDLALELETLAPELGSVATAHAEHMEDISATFNSVIIAQNVQVGQHFTANYGVSIAVGDVDSLDRYLQALGISQSDDRKEVIEAALAVKSQGADVIETDSRLKTAMKKAAGLAGKMSEEAANILIKALIQHWIGT